MKVKTVIRRDDGDVVATAPSVTAGIDKASRMAWSPATRGHKYSVHRASDGRLYYAEGPVK